MLMLVVSNNIPISTFPGSHHKYFFRKVAIPGIMCTVLSKVTLEQPIHNGGTQKVAGTCIHSNQSCVPENVLSVLGYTLPMRSKKVENGTTTPFAFAHEV